MEKIELRDFLNFQFLSGVKASPDGSKAVFTVTQADLEQNGYTHNLWLWDSGAVRPLTEDGTSDSFVWEDSSHLLLPAVSRGKTVWNRMDLSTGEVTEAFCLPYFVRSMQPFGAGDWFFTAREGGKPDPSVSAVETLPIRFNGLGYSSGAVSSLYLYSGETGEVRKLSPDGFSVTHAVSFGNAIVYSGAESCKVGAKYDDIRICTPAGGEDHPLYEKKDLSILDLHCIAGEIVVIARDRIHYSFDQNPTIYRLDREQGLYIPLWCGDLNLENSVVTDSSWGMSCAFSGDGGDFLYFIATEGSSSHLKRMDAEGRVIDVCGETGSVLTIDAPAGGPVYLIAQYGMMLNELYRVTDHLEKLTDLNGPFFSGKIVAQPQPLSVSACGTDIDGWVLLPADYDPLKKYPAVLEIHGGPKNVFSAVYYHELQVLSAAGYFVLFCNPIGSDGKGTQFFEAIRGQYGTLDYESLMAFEEAAVEAYPQIDQARIAVTGGSYGGYLTNWVIGHTDRFACAVSQRSISNLISFWGTADVGYNSVTDKNGGDIFHAEQQLWEQSPVKYADQVKTPTLFLHSDEDYRCPLEQGIQMYTAVSLQGVDTRLVVFKGENHSLSRSGKPANRIRRMEEMLRWFETYTSEP